MGSNCVLGEGKLMNYIHEIESTCFVGRGWILTLLKIRKQGDLHSDHYKEMH